MSSATVDGTLVQCGACRSLFAPPNATYATIVGGEDEAHSGVRAQVPLDAEFRSRYELGKVLGAGAAGTVYAARERALSRMVAIKFLTAVAQGISLERFVREGLILSGLNHPNVIRERRAPDR